MKRFVLITAAVLACVFAAEGRAQAPSPTDRPVNATAVCKDGTFSTHTDREEACKANRGVQEWWGSKGPPVSSNSTTTNSPRPAGASGQPTAAMAQHQVWADPETKMYHRCTTGDEHDTPAGREQPTARQQAPGGQLMTEEQAKAKGFRTGAHKMNCR